MKDAILLVFANKQDQAGSLNAAQARPNLTRCNYKVLMYRQVSEALGLATLRDRQWSIQETSALKGKGLFEGFDW